MRILWDNEVDKYTPIASSEDPAYPAVNAQHVHLDMAWRTTGLAGEFFKVDAGVGLTIAASCAVIAAHNLTAGATIKVQGHPTDSWGAPDMDQAFTWDGGVMIVFFAAASKRFWRFYLDDAGNPDGYISVGRLALGEFLQMPPVEPSFGLPSLCTSKSTVSESGQVYGNRGYLFLTPAFSFPQILQSERVGIDEMWAGVDNTKPVFLVVWEESLDVQRPIYCKIDQEKLDWRAIGEAGLAWELDLDFLEVR